MIQDIEHKIDNEEQERREDSLKLATKLVLIHKPIIPLPFYLD